MQSAPTKRSLLWEPEQWHPWSRLWVDMATGHRYGPGDTQQQHACSDCPPRREPKAQEHGSLLPRAFLAALLAFLASLAPMPRNSVPQIHTGL